MAPRVTPASNDADNSAGRAAAHSALARCNDWRLGARRFHVGTGHPEPTHDAGYTTAGAPFVPVLPISLFLVGGSPYTLVRARVGTVRRHLARPVANHSCAELEAAVWACGVVQGNMLAATRARDHGRRRRGSSSRRAPQYGEYNKANNPEQKKPEPSIVSAD